MSDTTQDAETKAPELMEIATSADGRDITQPYTDALRANDDPILQARGEGIEAYSEVLRDDQVHSCVQQRMAALVSAEWEVQPGAEDAASRKAADLLKEQLTGLLIDQITRRMWYGVWYGYAVGEMIWSKDGQHYGIDAIKVRRARRFRFDKDGGLRLLTQGNMHQGELMPPRKFWTFTSGAEDDDTPYGRGLGYWCFWPAFFKRHDLSFWLHHLDKFGGPTSVGKYPGNADKDAVQRLLAAAAAMRRDSAVAIPENMSLEFQEAMRGGEAGFERLYDRMNGAISKVILSQTMTTDDGSSHSQSEVHMDVREDVVKSDADLLCESFNLGPAKWLTDWNYPGATPPRLWREVEPPEDLDQLASRDTKVYELGYRPKQDYIDQTYGEGWEPDPDRDKGQSETQTESGDDPDAAVSFAAPDDADSIQTATQGLDGDWEELLDDIVKPLRDHLETATTLEEAKDGLIDALDNMDDAQLAEHLARVGFSARLAGELGAPLSNKDET